MNRLNERYRVNLFRPAQGGMRDEVGIILAVLAGWGVAIFGSQGLIALCAGGSGWSPWGITLFHLPLHYFFTAQFLPLWFIVLCLVFNIYLDRLALRHSRRKDRSYE